MNKLVALKDAHGNVLMELNANGSPIKSPGGSQREQMGEWSTVRKERAKQRRLVFQVPKPSVHLPSESPHKPLPAPLSPQPAAPLFSFSLPPPLSVSRSTT